MIFRETKIEGVVVVEPEASEDTRGLFARTFSLSEFSKRGLMATVVEGSVSFNPHKGTLRGMHYQAEPHAESKLVRCSRGSIFDVAIDLRAHSRTYRHWHGELLSADNRTALHVPQGCAHGFVTLEDSTELIYLIDQPYNSKSARGVRWDDSAFGIVWPEAPRMISKRDATYPDFLP